MLGIGNSIGFFIFSSKMQSKAVSSFHLRIIPYYETIVSGKKLIEARNSFTKLEM